MLYDEIEDKEMAARFLSRQSQQIQPQLWVKYKPMGTCLPKHFADIVPEIRDFEIRESDVFVLSNPKSGTTWTQEMVWLLGNDLDYEGAKTLLNIRFPYLEYDGLAGPSIKQNRQLHQVSLEDMKNLPSPRFIKSHLHWPLLPKQIETKKPKIVYVARNPKDQCVSLYHFKGLLSGYTGTMEEFIEEFLEGYYICGPYWPHIREAWNRRNEPNVLFLKYEDMIKDLGAVVRQTAAFLGKSYTDEQYAKLVDHLSFASMKNNPAVNSEDLYEALSKYHGKPKTTSFIRKGKVGSWEEELSPECIKRVDDWIAKNKIEGIWENV